jgi:hypothetical protein
MLQQLSDACQHRQRAGNQQPLVRTHREIPNDK